MENYQLQSGEGLSLTFIYIWLLGDLCNLCGAALAHLLPTVIILGVYVSARGYVLSHQSNESFDSIHFVIPRCFSRYITIDGRNALEEFSKRIVRQSNRACWVIMPLCMDQRLIQPL